MQSGSVRLVLAAFCASSTLMAQSQPVYRWIQQVPAPGGNQFAGLGVDAAGNTWVVSNVKQHILLTKFDSAGAVLLTRPVGGSQEDKASAAAVDPAGNVYVTGTTFSTDFPVTPGAYRTTLPVADKPFGPTAISFLFSLDANGATRYSTYFTSQSFPTSIAVDASGAAVVSGSSYGNLPLTPGAYKTTCACNTSSTGFAARLIIFMSDGFATLFNPQGNNLVFSTYLGFTRTYEGDTPEAAAIAPDGSVYIADIGATLHLNAAGTALLGSSPVLFSPKAIALAPDGTVYVGGLANRGDNAFAATRGAVQAVKAPPPLADQNDGASPGAVIRLSADLSQTLSATYFGGNYGSIVNALAVGKDGVVYLAGGTSPRALPTRSSFVAGIGVFNTGFAAALSSDLTQLRFSTFLGNRESFRVQGLAAIPSGSVSLAGTTDSGVNAPSNVWINSLAEATAPPVRLDSIENAASHLTDAITAAETVVLRGSGFSDSSQVLIAGAPAPVLTRSAEALTALTPSTLPTDYATVQVRNAAAESNTLLAGVATVAPGLFSADGSGYGQGYILNENGTLNTPANPAVPNEKITIFVTGAGQVNINSGYAEPVHPVSVFIQGFYCLGVAAVMRPVAGLPGDVFQLTVRVPDPAALVANNPDLKFFKFAPLAGIVLKMDGLSSQRGIAISVRY